MSEHGEGPKPYLEIVAPEYLDEGQNLFDQEPFSGACQEIKRRYSLEESVVRRMLGTIVSQQDPLGTSYPTPTERFAEKTVDEQTLTLQRYANKVLIYSNVNLETLPKDTVYRSVRIFFRNLINFPYWGEYIGINVNGGGYKLDGESFGRAKKYIPVESYGKWVTNRFKAEGNRVLWGIDEAFPEQPQRSGSRRKRRWQILSASEITREKR